MSPRTEQKNEAIREESRARILEAGLAVFARAGFQRASVRAIAREAGVAQGLLYNYFASKDDLLRAIFQRSLQDVQESFESMQPSDTPEQQLEDLIRRSFEILRQNLAFWRLFYSVRAQPAVVAGLADDLQRWTDLIRQALIVRFTAMGADQPEIQAALLFATIDGVAQHYALDPNGYPLDAVVSEFASMIRRRSSARWREQERHATGQLG